jgi:hypothetical protein
LSHPDEPPLYSVIATPGAFTRYAGRGIRGAESPKRLTHEFERLMNESFGYGLALEGLGSLASFSLQE